MIIYKNTVYYLSHYSLKTSFNFFYNSPYTSHSYVKVISDITCCYNFNKRGVTDRILRISPRHGWEFLSQNMKKIDLSALIFSRVLKSKALTFTQLERSLNSRNYFRATAKYYFFQNIKQLVLLSARQVALLQVILKYFFLNFFLKALFINNIIIFSSKNKGWSNLKNVKGSFKVILMVYCFHLVFFLLRP